MQDALARKMIADLEAKISRLGDNRSLEVSAPLRMLRADGLTSISIEREPFGRLMVQNVRSTGINQYGIVALGAKLAVPQGFLTTWYEDYIWESSSPVSTAPFAVLQQEAAPGDIVHAVMSGTTLALVNLTDLTHAYASVTTSDYDRLTSSATATSCEILDADDDAATTLAQTATATDATIIVASGVKFPNVPFIARIGTEDVYVSAVDTSREAWTVMRGYGSTTAAAHSVGDAVTFRSGTVWCLIRISGNTNILQCEPTCIDVMTCASLIQDASDNVVAIQVGRRQMCVDASGCWTLGPVICEINPANCCPDESGSGSGSGATPWWCVEVQECVDAACTNCDITTGVACVNYAFSAIGASRCVAFGSGYRREVAIAGPFNNEASCVQNCGGVTTACCDVVPQNLCALLSDGGGMSCSSGLGIDLQYMGVGNVPCNTLATDCIECTGLTGPTWQGSLTFCGHPVTLQLACGSNGYWYAKITWSDGCGAPQWFSDCNGTLSVLQCTPKFHLRFKVQVPDNCTSGGGGGGGGTVVTDCCGNPVSDTLYGSVSMQTGTCTCVTDFTMTYDSLYGAWISTIICGSGFQLWLQCIEVSPGVMGWSLQQASIFATTTLVSESCPPTFQQVWDCVGSPITCTGSCRITLTEL